MQIEIEELDGVELIPGAPVTIAGITTGMMACIDEDGLVERIYLTPHGTTKPMVLQDGGPHVELFRPLRSAIHRQYRRELEEHAASFLPNDPSYGRLHQSELR